MNQLKIALVAAIAILAGNALRQPAAANTPVPCSGDDSACQLLVVEQRGTDPNSGAYPPAIHQSAAIYAAIDDADVVDRLLQRQLRLGNRHLRLERPSRNRRLSLPA
jgi:hypothetical protein